MDDPYFKNQRFYVGALISAPNILKEFDKILEDQAATYFPSKSTPQLMHLTWRASKKLDEDSNEIVLIEGFKELKLSLLNLMFVFSKKGPITYIERVLENMKLSESVIVVDKNKNIYEKHDIKNAIATLFESGLIQVSRELKEYIGPSIADPKKLIQYRQFKVKHKDKVYVIEESLPEIGWYLNVYDKNGVLKYDYLQYTYDVCKRVAEEKFGVPLSAWEQ